MKNTIKFDNAVKVAALLVAYTTAVKAIPFKVTIVLFEELKGVERVAATISKCGKRTCKS